LADVDDVVALRHGRIDVGSHLSRRTPLCQEALEVVGYAGGPCGDRSGVGDLGVRLKARRKSPGHLSPLQRLFASPGVASVAGEPHASTFGVVDTKTLSGCGGGG